ncbi:AAA family ATPase [Nocardia sp. NPDC047654]|uniref:AAA family ATPase n=1 Tax=Nocardia sp. NPDC047654 TaxID=3364314 RepID=UPI003723C3A4
MNRSSRRQVAELIEYLLPDPMSDTLFLCAEPVGGSFREVGSYVGWVDQIAAVIDQLGDANVWYAAQEMDGDGRREANVARMRAVYADLDFKAAAQDRLEAVITELAGLVGARPTYVVASGHGLQPVWCFEEPFAVDDNEDRREAKHLLKRWGHLVGRVAESHGVKADSVWDLARLLRMPGTTNTKPDMEPVAATIESHSGEMVSIDRIREVLDENDIPELSVDEISDGIATDAEVEAFIAENREPGDGERAEQLRDATLRMLDPSSRHPSMMRALFLSCEEIAAGLQASAVIGELRRWWDEHTERRGYEFRSMLATAVASASGKSEQQLAEVEVNSTQNVPVVTVLEEVETTTDTNSATDTMRLWRATELVASDPPGWIARNRIPKASVTLLVGDEGIGKSLFWVWLVTLVTTGQPCPEFGIPARAPQNVRLILTEDDWVAVRDRLEVAGADLDRIRVLCAERDGTGSPTMPGPDMAWVLDTSEPYALLVADAWLDTVPGKLNVKDPQQARKVLHPWREAAIATGATQMLLTHTNRIVSNAARDRYGITGELRKKARLCLYAQTDEQGRLLIGPEKANTTATVPSSIFRVDVVQKRPPSDDDDGTVARLVYVGDSDKTAGDHVVEATARATESPMDTDCRAWLRDYMDKNLGSVAATVAEKAMHAEGFTQYAIRTAKRKLGIVSRKDGDHWLWLSTQ